MALRRIIHKVRRKIGRIYLSGYIYRWLQLKGALYSYFFKFLYPNLRVGDNARIWGPFYVTMYDAEKSAISIGNNLHMVSDSKRAGITVFSPCKLTTIGSGQIIIGDNVQLNGVAITSRKCIKIGDGVLIAPNCIVVDSDFHTLWPPEERRYSDPSATDKEVVIGDNTWLGINVTVLKGAEIGDNSIIAAGSVVSGKIPPNVMAGGAPARVIKDLI